MTKDVFLSSGSGIRTRVYTAYEAGLEPLQSSRYEVLYHSLRAMSNLAVVLPDPSLVRVVPKGPVLEPQDWHLVE
jgi:hypothetical protein